MFQELGERRISRRKSFKEIGIWVGGFIATFLGIREIGKRDERAKKERERQLAEELERTGGFRIETAGPNVKTVTLLESGKSQCDEDACIDVRQETLANALQQIKDEGCEIETSIPIEATRLLGSETTGFVVTVDCEEGASQE